MILEDPVWFDPAYARTSFLPITNANLDLGSSSLFFRSLFLNTSLVFNGSSNVFKINANTIDSSDNKRLSIGGGGDTLATRGAWALFNGNEYASQAGYLYLICGDVAGAGLTFRMSNFGNSFVNFENGGSTIVLSISQTGTISYNNTNFRIASVTADGSDNQGAFFCGGGSNTVSRGAVVFIGGNEYSGSNGVLSLSAGDASSAYVIINAPSAVSPTIRFSTGSERWRMNGAGDFTGYGGSSNAINRLNDTGQLILVGGSTANPSNSSYIRLYGNSHATDPGVIQFLSGSNAGAYIRYNALATGAVGYHRFDIDSIERWRMSGDDLYSYATSVSQIRRVNNTSSFRFIGGSAASTGNGAWIEAHGIGSGSGAGILRFYTGNDSASHSIHITGNVSANHRFYVNNVEKFRITNDHLWVADVTAPAGTPTGGGYLYSEAGALRWKGSSGTVTTLAPA